MTWCLAFTGAAKLDDMRHLVKLSTKEVLRLKEAGALGWKLLGELNAPQSFRVTHGFMQKMRTNTFTEATKRPAMVPPLWRGTRTGKTASRRRTL